MSASELFQFFDPQSLNAGIEETLGTDLISYLDGVIRGSGMYQEILKYFNELMGAAIFVWGLFYFLKAFWDMLRGQESWDEFFVFIVKKSLPVIVLFLFVWPINLPPLLTTGSDPFGIYIFKMGEDIAFNLPQRFLKKDLQKKGIQGKFYIETSPFVLASNTLIFNKAKQYLKQPSPKPVDDSDKSNNQSNSTNNSGFFSSIRNALSGVKGIWEGINKIFSAESWVGGLLVGFLKYVFNVSFKFGFVIMVFTIFIAFLIQLVLIKLKFIFFIPLFYLSTIFLLFDRYRDIFYDNLKTLFAWMLQPTFLILATYAAIEVGLFVMLLFVTDDSFIVKVFENVFASGYNTWNLIRIFILLIGNLVMVFLFLKMALTVPYKTVEGVFNGLSRIVSTAFRSIE